MRPGFANLAYFRAKTAMRAATVGKSLRALAERFSTPELWTSLVGPGRAPLTPGTATLLRLHPLVLQQQLLRLRVNTPLAHTAGLSCTSTAVGASAEPTSYLLLLQLFCPVMVSVFLCRLFVCLPAGRVGGPMPGSGFLVARLEPENAIRSVIFASSWDHSHKIYFLDEISIHFVSSSYKSMNRKVHMQAY